MELKKKLNKFFGESSMPHLRWEETWKSFTLNLFDGTRFRVWVYISKFREEKLHFCFTIGSVITLDTAYIGKRICGRLSLTRLFKKDYHVYSSGNDVQSPK